MRDGQEAQELSKTKPGTGQESNPHQPPLPAWQ